jgi:hypothetical protein
MPVLREELQEGGANVVGGLHEPYLGSLGRAAKALRF